MKFSLQLFMLGLLSLGSVFGQENSFFDEADAFFAKFVNNGLVDYQAISESPQGLDNLIAQVEVFSLENKDNDTQKAFLINAYNLQVINGVIRAYPFASTQQIGGFFDRNTFTVSGKKYTLDALEKEELFVRFPDYRLHFVLNCAALSCPQIVPFSYKPAILNQQLNDQTSAALKNEKVLRLEKGGEVLFLNQIFKWYASDFSQAYPDIRSFLEDFGIMNLPPTGEIKYMEYDWSLNALTKASVGGNLSEDGSSGLSNIQRFTPSVLLRKGQVEAKLFNNLYTQTAFRNGEQELVDLNQRQSFYTGIFQFNYGVDRNSRWNLGFELNVHGVRYDADPSSSFLKVLGNDPNNLDFRKMAVSYAGPRIRFAPFRSIPKFSITSTFLFPLRNDLELLDDTGNQRFLAHNRASWWTQIFYDYSFGQFQLFTELDFLLRLPTDEVSFTQEAFFRTPATVFFSYFPSSKATLNVNFQYSPAFTGLPGNDSGTSFNLNRWFMQGGLGAKYQLTPEINLEVIYTNFFASKGEGAGETFNFGIVFIK